MKSGNPEYVQRVFNNFNARRDALIKALTTDFDEFFKQCDLEKGNLCLFGFPSGNWEVNVPAEQVPTDLPEPASGINFARDMMQVEDWLALVVVGSDAWIQLFNKINELPTVFETVFDTRRKQGKENASSSNSEGNKSKSSSEGVSEQKQQSEPEGKKRKKVDDLATAKEGGEDDRVLCGGCGENYTSDEFWICCQFCEKWYHGLCVKITPPKAEHIEQCKCPSCYRKKLSGS